MIYDLIPIKAVRNQSLHVFKTCDNEKDLSIIEHEK
jgi:hypothetical protein